MLLLADCIIWQQQVLRSLAAGLQCVKISSAPVSDHLRQSRALPLHHHHYPPGLAAHHALQVTLAAGEAVVRERQERAVALDEVRLRLNALQVRPGRPGDACQHGCMSGCCVLRDCLKCAVAPGSCAADSSLSLVFNNGAATHLTHLTYLVIVRSPVPLALQEALTARTHAAHAGTSGQQVALGVMALEAALQAGRPCARELALLRSACGPAGDQLVEVAVASVPAEAAARGIPSHAQLVSRWVHSICTAAGCLAGDGW